VIYGQERVMDGQRMGEKWVRDGQGTASDRKGTG
jgi:hypothetical protein